jgi:hypothetical protein
MDPRKLSLVVLAVAFTFGAGARHSLPAAGAQPLAEGTFVPPTCMISGRESEAPASLAGAALPAPDAARSQSELIDVLAHAYRNMDLDLYATLFANARAHQVEFTFVLYRPSDDGTTAWGYDEEMRIHRRMFRPADTRPGETPVPRRLWVRSIDVTLTPLGSWSERFDLYRSEHNPAGPLDRHRWRASSTEYATSVTWHTIAGPTMHIEGQARFVVIDDLSKSAGEPGKLLVYRWEDLGPAPGGLAQASGSR